LPHFAIIPQQQQKKPQKSRMKEEKNQVVSLCFHGQKVHQRDVVIPLFDNPIVKKLKTYTKHSQFTKMKVQGNEKKKKKEKRAKRIKKETYREGVERKGDNIGVKKKRKKNLRAKKN
jgi:hypothetical protein